MLARKAEQSDTLKEAAQSMGYHRWRYFFTLHFPRQTAIVTGAALAMMRCLLITVWCSILASPLQRAYIELGLAWVMNKWQRSYPYC